MDPGEKGVRDGAESNGGEGSCGPDVSYDRRICFQLKNKKKTTLSSSF